MKWWLAAVGIALLSQMGIAGVQVGIADLRCESAVDPLGLDVPQPRLSWKLHAAAAGLRGQTQSAYRILVASTQEGLENEAADLWDSGRVISDASVQIPYGGKTLVENQQAFWKVQIWDQADVASEWSEVSRWSMGLFDNASWKGKWIGSAATAEIATTIETRFTIAKEALGIYFHADGSTNSCMWQINTTGGRTRLLPHIRVDGNFSILKEVPLALNPSAFQMPHTMKIVITGASIETFLDGQSIDITTEDTRHGAGFGFRASSTEEATIQELTVSSNSGKVLYHAAYPAGLKVANGEVMLGVPNPALTPMLRKEFVIAKPVKRAWIHASSLGIYEMHLNGAKVGDAFFAPGWTNYRKSVEFQTFDVTALVKTGTNAIGSQLAAGWFAGNIAWFGTGRYGSEARFIAELHVEYADGTGEVIAQTDDSWKSSDGPVVSADFQDGESYDARLEKTGWDQGGYHDAAWQPVRMFGPFEASRLVAQTDPLMKILETVVPSAVSEPTPGVYVYKLPRNITGVPWIRIKGTAGTTVHIRCSEAANADGSLNQKTQFQPGIPGKFSSNADSYTFATTGEAIYYPRFSWRGFRYIEVSGTTEKPVLADVAGLSIGTNVPNTGTLVTSDGLVNQISNIMKWSGQCAYISIPVDSPQRCERLGWTGDANFYLKTATFNFDVERFFTKWQRDGMYSQTAEGCYSNVTPGGWGSGADGGYGGGWGDVGVCAPYELWRTYGNTALVRESYGSMARYITYLQGQSSGLIVNGGMAPAGDWQNQGDGTPADFIATAYWAYDVKLMSEMAAAIGKNGDATMYAALYDQIRAAIRSKWISADGTVASGSQTSQVMALHIGLVPDELKEAAVNQLVANISRHGNHLTTGFVGTQWLLTVLSDAGRPDVACALLRQTSNPSWGYMVGLGTTTIWENWNVMNSDGSIIDGANSLNHCALGTAGEWMFRNIGGIDQEPGTSGFSKVVIRPSVTDYLTSAKTVFESVHGTISTQWVKGATTLKLNVEIPVNTTASVYVPCTDVGTVREGALPAGEAPGVKHLRDEAGYAVFEVGSGSYQFSASSLTPVLVTDTSPATAADVVGSEATFTANFRSSLPTTYQWQKVVNGMVFDIPGQTNPTLTLTKLQLVDSAAYRLKTSNRSGDSFSTASPLTVSALPAAVANVTAAYAAQTGLGSAVLNFSPTWRVAEGSLIAGRSPSAVGSGNFLNPTSVLTDGSIGRLTAGQGAASVTQVVCGGGGGQSVTYNLGTAAGGYNLSSIAVYGGWCDSGRDQQAYTVYYATASAPATFIKLASVNYNPADPASVQSASRSILRSATAAPLASNVAALKFDFTSPAPENGYCGYSEIAVYGASAVPSVTMNTVPATAVDVVGGQVTFNASIAGAPPLSYQWQKVVGSVTSDIVGATSQTLILTDLQSGDAASYQLKATNAGGVATSAPGKLTVNALPPAVNNVVTAMAAQTGLGGNTTFVPGWSLAMANNLIAASAPSAAAGNFSLGTTGASPTVLTAGDSLAIVSPQASDCGPNYLSCGNGGGAGSSLVYTLPESASGYVLMEITVHGGWRDSGRDQQAYTISYSTTASPATFVPLITVNYNPASPASVQSATRARLTAASGALVTNAAAVKFDFTSPTTENGWAGYSQIAIYGAAVLSAPMNLAAVRGDAQAILSWTAVPGATSYNVRRATMSGGPYTKVGSATTAAFVNTGLTNGTPYYYVVTALNAAGETAPSSQLAVTPAAASGYDSWVATYRSLTGNNSAPGADPDHDGQPNAIEFLAGTSPVDSSSRAAISTTRDGLGNLVLHFKRAVAARSYAVTVDSSTDLTSVWTSVTVPAIATAGPPVTVVDNGDGGDDITVVIASAGALKKFARIGISSGDW